MVLIGCVVIVRVAGNYIGPAGMEHLAGALRVNTTVTTLNLEGTCAVGFVVWHQWWLL